MIRKRDSDLWAACDEPHLIGLPAGVMIAPLSFELLSVTLETAPRGISTFDDHEAAYLHFHARVLDRDCAEPRTIAFSKRILKGPIADDDRQNYLAGMVRDGLRQMMSHEVDELLLQDGVRIRDPHALDRVALSVNIGPGPRS